MFFLIIIFFSLIGGLLALVAVQNLALSVHLNLFSWQTPDLPVGMWLIAAFLLGAMVLYLVSVFSALRDRHELKALRRQVLLLEKQIAPISSVNASSTGRITGDRSSVATTGPLVPMLSASTSQPGKRIPTSPLAPMQNFRQ